MARREDEGIFGSIGVIVSKMREASECPGFSGTQANKDGSISSHRRFHKFRALSHSHLGGRVRQLLGLAVPIIGAMLSQNLLNLIDTAMVGRLGAPALGAVGLGSMVSWFAGSFFMALGSGVQAISSRRIGEGRSRGAGEALHGALVITVLLALPYAIFLTSFSDTIFRLLTSDAETLSHGIPYLQIRLFASVFVVANFSFRGFWNGIGKSTVYLQTIILIHFVNILLNWLLIYGHLGFPALGTRGAAIASACAVALGSVRYAFLARREFRAMSGDMEPSGFGWSASRTTLRSILVLSLPAGLQNLFLSAGFVAFYRIAEIIGTKELAISAVLINLSMLCLLPNLGFGLASATFVGRSLGTGDQVGAQRWGWTGVMTAAVSMIVLGGVLVLAPYRWLSLLINDPEAAALGVVPLIILGLMQPIDSVGIVLTQSLIGAGAVRIVTLISVVLQWGFFLPSAYIVGVVQHGGLLALWIAMACWRISYALVIALVFRRGRWATTRV